MLNKESSFEITMCEVKISTHFDKICNNISTSIWGWIDIHPFSPTLHTYSIYVDNRKCQNSTPYLEKNRRLTFLKELGISLIKAGVNFRVKIFEHLLTTA